jgi:hypothetical protein
MTDEDRHEIACASSANLMAYLGWLRSGDLFCGDRKDLTLTQPEEGPTQSLPPGIGAVEYNLSEETNSDPCRTTDVIMTWETLSGLSVEKWLEKLVTFEPHDGTSLFSTQTQPVWTSRYFREEYTWPLLEQMRRKGGPTLKCFSAKANNGIKDKIYSLHSWRRAGQS